jgi:hypothetical protein
MATRTTLGLAVCTLLAACQAVRSPVPIPTQNPASDPVTPEPPEVAVESAAGLTAEPTGLSDSGQPTSDADPAAALAGSEGQRILVGESWEGRSIWAWQFGQGPHTIILVGGIHGGYEGNTVRLVEQIVNHFLDHPDDVLPGVRLALIPVANPDGYAQGDGLDGRFNARGVDLNRNWGCDWSDTAVLRDIEIDPGPSPFSEPEAQALRDFFIAEEPSAVVFYHSMLGGVIMGDCGDAHPAAIWLGDLLEEATGYPHLDEFTPYEVTGDASNWLARQGIPAATIELYTRTETELDENLAGVHALQCHFARQALAGQASPAVARLCE